MKFKVPAKDLNLKSLFEEERKGLFILPAQLLLTRICVC
jgi:hypothetical protein